MACDCNLFYTQPCNSPDPEPQLAVLVEELPVADAVLAVLVDELPVADAVLLPECLPVGDWFFPQT